MTPSDKAQAVSLVGFCTCWGLVIWWVIHMDSELKKQYYTVEIVGVESPNFQDATPTPTPPSFNITMRIDNRYDHDLYIRDWSYSSRLDGVPLGRGSFPDGLTAHRMSETTVTGTTSTALVGIGKEASNGRSMEDLELLVDMKFSVIGTDVGITAPTWLWCSARFSDHSAPSLCRHRIVGWS